MRFVFSLTALTLLAACQVTKDDANDSVSMTYNQDVAENAAADVGNTAQGIATEIGDDVKATGDKIDNKIDDKDVSVNVQANVDTNAH